jgi:ABC-type glycerol-3-phosphate transport system substrate-binding protein
MIKKVLTISLFLILLVLVGCGITTTETTTSTTAKASLSTTSSSQTTTSTTTSTTTTTTTTITEQTGLSQALVDTFLDQSVTIELSYRLNTEQSAALELMISAFEEKFPHVDIVSTRESSDRTVATEFVTGVLGGQGADLILLDQAYLASILANSLEPLDDYLNSSASVSGFKVGVDLTKIEENFFTSIPEIESTISFPFTRLAQLMFANRDVLADNAQALTNNGVTVSDEGFISRTSQLSYSDLETIANVITDQTILTFERPNLMFETLLGQINVSKITDNSYAFNQVDTIDLMSSLRTLSNNNVLALASNFQESYTSSIFLSEDTLFALSDASSLRYMTNGVDFNIDILPVVKAEESGSMFFGSDFGINSNSTDIEKFYAWMFIRFVTDLSPEYVGFCFDFGYAPIYNNLLFIQDIDYMQSMSVLQEYAIANGNPSWPLEDERWDEVYLSMIQSVYMIYRSNIIERAFILSTNSTGVENKITYIDNYMEDVFYGIEDVSNLITILIDNLNSN